MRLSDLVLWLIDLPPGGWRLLGAMARIYQSDDLELRQALVSQVELLARMLPPARKTVAAGLCYTPASENLSVVLMPNGRGGLYVMVMSTTRVSSIDPGPERRSA